MRNKIKVTDLEILLKVFAPKEYTLYLFDPFGRLDEDKYFNNSQFEIRPFKVLINLANKVICYKDIPLEDFDLIIDFGKSEISNNFMKREYDFINNPKGGMRWIYPMGKIKSALSFYNTSSFRSKMISRFLTLKDKLGLNSIMGGGNFTVNFKDQLRLDEAFKGIEFDHYSIFTGTAGYNRTAVVAIEKSGDNTHFAKIALNRQGERLLSNERMTLNSMNNRVYSSMILPRVITTADDSILITTNESPKSDKNLGAMTEKHTNVLAELFNRSRVLQRIDETQYWDNVTSNLKLLETNKDYINQNLILLLRKLYNEVDPRGLILTSLAHSDFTPWNIKETSTGLYVYDWELSRSNIPALFDLIHFHFQNDIMVKRKGLNSIFNEIKKSCEISKIKTIIDNHHLDINECIKLYLLRTVSYYLATIQEQGFISTEQKLQLNVWNQAIKANLGNPAEQSCRKIFIQEFYPVLKSKLHAMLKFDCESISVLPESSDLDIAIRKSDLNSIIQYCKNHEYVLKSKILKKSFMTTIQLFFKDDSFISIDLITQFKRKGKTMMDILPLLNSAHVNAYGVMVPDPRFDLEYSLLFYTLNGSNIPERYFTHFSKSSEDVMAKTLRFINEKYMLDLSNFRELFQLSSSDKKQLTKSLSQMRGSKKKQLIDQVNYLLDTIKAVLTDRGFMVTLSGVDGVGKSTIVQRVKESMEMKYRREVVLLRHRPGILPILSAIKHGSIEAAENAAGTNLPRKGKNKNILSSILRFGYYYLDYIIGQVYVYFKFIIKGKIVLYDRYYFDFITDPKRSNITLNRSVIKFLYAFVFKPRLNILLWANEKEVHRRKQELQPHTIKKLTNNYKTLFYNLSNRSKRVTYKTIENVKINRTVNKIMREFSQVA